MIFAQGLMPEIMSSPTTFMLGCLVIIPVVVWVLQIVSWMVMGEIEGWVGIVAILGGLVLCILTIKPPHPALAIPLFVMVVSMVVLVPMLRGVFTKRELSKIEVEQFEILYSNLLKRPDNIAAACSLADSLFERGFVDQAVAISQSALSQASKQVYNNEFRRLNHFRTLQAPASVPEKLGCSRCGLINELDALVCSRCQTAYLTSHFRGDWAGTHSVFKFVGSWIVAMIVLVALPATATGLPPPASLVLIPLEISLAIFTVWAMFFRKSKGATV